ncbi:MAG: DUF2651 family protein [Clostridia bacterium]|nr:DUF2651 family protein [Clostridia bacterium]
MNLFIFFALPLATILLAIVLQKILRSPILVAITFFAIYLIVAFAAFSDTLAEALIAAIIYSIIAYITAYIVMIICRFKHRFCNCSRGENNNTSSSDLLTVDSTCFANDSNNLNTNAIADTSITTNQIQNRTSNFGNRRCYRRM